MTMHAKESIHSSRKLLTGATIAAANDVVEPFLRVRKSGILPRMPLSPIRGTENAQVELVTHFSLSIASHTAQTFVQRRKRTTGKERSSLESFQGRKPILDS